MTPRVLHVIVTENFAGAERYVCDLSAGTSRRGWDVTVVGGHSRRMRQELGDGIQWLPGGNPGRAAMSVARAGRHDVCHVHMTYAEAVGVATRLLHRGRLVATRHFAQRRGLSRGGHLLAPWIARHMDAEIAISDFVASRMEHSPTAVIRNGVPDAPLRWRPENRTVLMVQRLEPEKDTKTGIRAWAHSGLADRGWRLRIVGDGSQRPMLEGLVRAEQVRGVEFAGWQADIAVEHACAGILLATAAAEPFGLSVAEAMAAGIPVVACGRGGHLETIGRVPGSVPFPPGDIHKASSALSHLVHDDNARGQLSAAVQEMQRHHLGQQTMVDRIIQEYDIESDRSGSSSLVLHDLAHEYSTEAAQ